MEEVAAYCKERGNNIDPEAFVDYYAARGWVYSGKSPMKDWRAGIRNWEKRAQAETASKVPQTRDYDIAGNPFR